MGKLGLKYCLQAKAKIARRIPEGHLTKVAKEAGLSSDKVYAWLNKGKGLSYCELFVLARYLHMDVDFVLDDAQIDDTVPLFPTTKYEGTVIRHRGPKSGSQSNRKRNSMNKKPVNVD